MCICALVTSPRGRRILVVISKVPGKSRVTTSVGALAATTGFRSVSSMLSKGASDSPVIRSPRCKSCLSTFIPVGGSKGMVKVLNISVGTGSMGNVTSRMLRGRLPVGLIVGVLLVLTIITILT